MTKSLLNEALRRNWHLLLLLAACVVILAIVVVKPAEEDGSLSPRGAPRVSGPGTTPTPPPTEPRQAPSGDAIRTIEQHRAELEVDPDGDRAPSLLLSIGNLYMTRLQQYDQAIANYERLIEEHPDWVSIRKAYVQLASAYEKDGQVDKAKSVYEEMMRRFPPDSVEYEYAKQHLEGGAETER